MPDDNPIQMIDTTKTSNLQRISKKDIMQKNLYQSQDKENLGNV